MEPGEQAGGVAEDGGEGVSDEELLRWAGAIAKARGRVQAARDVGLNYRTLARALDDQALTRFVREALLEAHRAGSADNETEGTRATDEELTQRVEGAEAQLADALDALERERARADALERRLELVEDRQAGEPGTEMPARTREIEPQEGELSTRQEADVESAAASSTGPAATLRNRATTEAEGPVAPTTALVSRGAHRAGVVTLEPLEGEQAALGDAAVLVAEWRRLRGEEARRGSAVERARAEERRWELELALIGEHGLALPPEAEPLHPSRRDDQLRWRRVTLARVRAARVRAERLRLLRRVLTLGLWWR